MELREEFNALMGAAVNYSFQKNRACADYIDEFAEYINQVARQRMVDGGERDAVITTNWDVMFDHA